MNNNLKKINDVSEQNLQSQTNETQYLTFELKNEDYCLQLWEAKEIIKPPEITSVPNTDDHVLGVINLRGRVTPIVDLKKKLGLGDNTYNNIEADKRIIITSVKGLLVGIFVDRIEEVIKIKKIEFEQLADSKRELRQEYIKGVFTHNKKLIVLINLARILFREEEEFEDV